MLNLLGGKAGDTLLDPFCGIGTILQEGMLLGFKMLGTDLNKHAIAGSEKNLEWFRNRYKIPKGKYHLEISDATKVHTVVENLKRIGAFKEVSGIVTEGTLGPNYSKYPKTEEIQSNFRNLAELYTQSFEEFSKFLINKGKIVICLPAYKRNATSYEMMPNLDFAKVSGYTTEDIFPDVVKESFGFLKLTQRGTIIYDRKDQIVAREIVIFRKT